MRAGTSPSITGLAEGGFQIAFQANSTRLWTVGRAGNYDLGLEMMAGTSPSISALPRGSFEIAYQANTGYLHTWGAIGTANTGARMLSNTSPSITGDYGGAEIAYQGATRTLWHWSF